MSGIGGRGQEGKAVCSENIDPGRFQSYRVKVTVGFSGIGVESRGVSVQGGEGTFQMVDGRHLLTHKTQSTLLTLHENYALAL